MIDVRVSTILLYLVVATILLYVLWGLHLLFRQPKLLYRPLRDVIATPTDRQLAYEEVAFHSGDGVRLTGWYIPAAGARFTILFCHGNGGNVMHALDSVELFHEMGLNCFVFDYRGYGASGGTPTEAGTYLDARAAFDWLTQVKRVGPREIIVCGRSLGGSIAAHLAAQVNPAGLVIEGAFTSYPDIGARLYPYLPVRLFAGFRYDTLAHLRAVRCPVLVVHSRDDELVPFDQGVRLFEAVGRPRQFAEIAGSHSNGFLSSADRYRQAWSTWLDSLPKTGCYREFGEPDGRNIRTREGLPSSQRD